MNTSLRASAHVSHKGWYSIDWNTIQQYVTKLRQRTYRVEQQNQTNVSRYTNNYLNAMSFSIAQSQRNERLSLRRM
jgi:hypothetical protein